MRVGGFGGFEVQPVYPLAVDGTPGIAANERYLSEGFISHLRHAARTGREQGLRVDVTLGSGWPFGGPHVPLQQASGQVRMERVPVVHGDPVSVPTLKLGETLLTAAASGKSMLRSIKLAADARAVPAQRLRGADEALFFIAGHTGQQVKRAAFGAEGNVIDHASQTAVQSHLATVGDRLMQAFAGTPPPDAVFSDSLEAYGASWTPDLPEQFRRRRGYDLLAHLPALFLDLPDSGAVRYDWARTLSELVEERYLAPIDAWARARGTRFRAQVYGFPPPTLSSNRLVSVPEGEGANWREFTSTRWATSGAHLYGKPVASSEVWTWLHSPAWAATPLDMKVEADRHFLQGVNQLVGHGWPYSPPGVPKPGWAFYAAAALNDHNPWYAAMPAVTAYLSRVSWMLRQGQAADGVAIYLPVEDAMAAMTPKETSVNEALHRHLPDALTPAVLDAGYGFDYVDAGALSSRPLPYKVLVLPQMERMDAAAMEALERWAGKGGKVIAIGAIPDHSGGLHDGEAVARLRAAAGRLQRMDALSVVPDVAALPAALHAAAPQDVTVEGAHPALGFVHRRTRQGHIYFFANTGNTPLRTTARPGDGSGVGQWWDPVSGKRWAAGHGTFDLDLAPYESRFLVFGEAGQGAVALEESAPRELPLRDWTTAAPGQAARKLDRFASWSEGAALRRVSGTAVYTARFDVPQARGCWMLDFGTARPQDPADATVTEARPVAQLEPPLREAAVVRVNGTQVGTVWAPPYRVDIAGALRSGENRLEISVPNSALNGLSGRPQPDRSELVRQFGERFTDQDVDRIAPRPSGLLQPVRLVHGPCR